MSDAIVVGARPNGLIAANLLADHGWSVLVLEEQDEPGGAVKSGELTVAGHVHDLFSAFYPFAAASQVIGGLDLEEHGLRWAHAESVVAHPREDGRCAVLSRDLDRTAASLDAYAPGDGDAWRRLFKIRGRSLGATYSVRASSRQRTRTSSGERSTAGRRKLTSSWSSARHPGISDGRRLQSAVSILRPPRRIPAAACMVAPERTRRGPRSRTGAPVAQPSVSAASPRRRRCDGSRVEVWLRRPEGI